MEHSHILMVAFHEIAPDVVSVHTLLSLWGLVSMSASVVLTRFENMWMYNESKYYRHYVILKMSLQTVQSCVGE